MSCRVRAITAQIGSGLRGAVSVPAWLGGWGGLFDSAAMSQFPAGTPPTTWKEAQQANFAQNSGIYPSRSGNLPPKTFLPRQNVFRAICHAQPPPMAPPPALALEFAG